MTERILSLIQPTGKPHLGNYFGAVRQWVACQEESLYGLALLPRPHHATQREGIALQSNRRGPLPHRLRALLQHGDDLRSRWRPGARRVELDSIVLDAARRSRTVQGGL